MDLFSDNKTLGTQTCLVEKVRKVYVMDTLRQQLALCPICQICQICQKELGLNQWIYGNGDVTYHRTCWEGCQEIAREARIDEIQWHRQMAKERYDASNGERADAATTMRVIDERIKALTLQDTPGMGGFATPEETQSE